MHGSWAVAVAHHLASMKGVLAVLCVQVLVGAGRANLLGLSSQETLLVQTSWAVYRNDSEAAGDIALAIKALVEQKPEVRSTDAMLEGVPLEGFEKHPGTRNVVRRVLAAADAMVSALEDDDKMERTIRSYAKWFHDKKIPVEELFLFPAGLVAEKMTHRVDDKMPFRPDEALTKCVFAVASLLCSPKTNDFLGLSQSERRELLRAWTWFRGEPTFAMELLVSVFDVMPDTRKMAPSLASIPTNKLMKNPEFKAFVEKLLTHLTTFVTNLDKYEQSVEYMRDLSRHLHNAGMPLLGTFLGGSILIIGAMKDHLGSEMDPLVERDMIKMTYASYPLLMEIERQEPS